MFEIAGGAVLVAAGIAMIVYFRARNGNMHWLVKRPGMETTVAIVSVGLISAGFAMGASGVLR